MILAVARKIPQANNSLLEGHWKRENFLGTQLYGKTLLIIGLGRIGSSVATRAKALGMEIFCYDPYINPVSYTHLDVYKRQVEEFMRLASQVRVAGILSGKVGIFHLHVGTCPDPLYICLLYTSRCV